MYHVVMAEEQGPSPAASPSFKFITLRPKGRRPAVARLLADREAFNQILMLIRMGCFDHVAAQACGIGLSTWYRWLAEGEQHAEEGMRSAAREFWELVRQAQAQARVKFELEVAREDPKFWLRCGPGKTRRGAPGWTETVALTGDEDGAPLSISMAGSVADDEASPQDLARTLLEMYKLGLVQGENAKGIIDAGHSPRRIAAEDTDDDDGPDDGIDRGHHPYATTPIDQIEREDRLAAPGPAYLPPDDLPDQFR